MLCPLPKFMAAILQPLISIFKSELQFKSVQQAIDEVKYINQLLDVTQVNEFTSRFDLSGYVEPKFGSYDVCFIDIKDLLMLTLGKLPAFNQCRIYYRRQTVRVLVAISQLRFLLLQLTKGEANAPLKQLTWNYVLFERLKKLKKPAAEYRQLLPMLLRRMFAFPAESEEMAPFLQQIGQFVHKYRLVLGKCSQSSPSFVQQLNSRFPTPLDFSVLPKQSTAVMLALYPIEEAKQLCEAVQQYFVPTDVVVFADSFDYLSLFVDQLRLRCCGQLKRQIDLPVDQLLNLTLQDQIALLAVSNKPVAETEWLAQLVAFRLSGEICFFDELGTLRAIKAGLDDVRQVLLQASFFQNQLPPCPSALEMLEILQRHPSFQNAPSDAVQREVQCTLPKRLLKFLQVNFGSVNEMFALINDSIGKLNYVTGERATNLAQAIRYFAKKVLGINVQAECETVLNKIQEDCCNIDFGHIEREILQIRQQSMEGGQKIVNYEVSTQKLLSIEQQVQMFGKSFETEEELVNSFTQTLDRTEKLTKIQAEFDSITDDFRKKFTELYGFAIKKQIRHAQSPEDLYCLALAVQKGENEQAAQTPELDALDKLLQQNQFNIINKVLLEKICSCIQKEQTKPGIISEKSNSQFLQSFIELSNAYVKPVLEDMRQQMKTKFKSILGAELQDYYDQAKIVTKEVFKQIVEIVKEVKTSNNGFQQNIQFFQVLAEDKPKEEIALMITLGSLKWAGIEVSYDDFMGMRF